MSTNARILKSDATWLLRTVAVTVALIILISFVLSFNSQRDLAIAAKIPEQFAAGWPLIVDGTIIVSTFSVIVLEGRGRRGQTTYAWLVLALFGAISIYANGVHATGRRPLELEAFSIGAVPAVALLLSTHLLVLMLRSPHEATSDEELVREAARAAAAEQRASRQTKPKQESAPTDARHVPDGGGFRPDGSAETDRPGARSAGAGSVGVPERVEQAAVPANTAPTAAAPERGVSRAADDVVELVRAYVDEHGKHPTGAQVGEWLGKAPRTGRRFVLQLVEDGVILGEVGAA